MKKAAVVIALVLLAAILYVTMFRPAEAPPPIVMPVPASPPEPKNNVEETKREMLYQLKDERPAIRTLDIPKMPELKEPEPAPTATPVLGSRALGRKKREGLPMGVVLVDNAPAFDRPGRGKTVFTMNTGDMVRVFPDQDPSYWHIQPGLDIYLAATTKETKPAGEHLPDRDAWVKKSELHIFEPEDAKEYIMEVTPVTLGNDTSFSTLAFYERAMKNVDPVVHRVAGPRLISLVMMHEDYSTSWSRLYRDRDPKIRDYALSAMSQRGLANNREIIEDLIVRLTELTHFPAKGETELEVLSILNALKTSGHPRVPAALASFKEAWKGTQSERINDALAEILQGQ